MYEVNILHMTNVMTSLLIPQGFEADSLSFALSTGAGDFAGVLAGHSLFSLYKSMSSAKPGSRIQDDLVTGLWLASAAFCSGDQNPPFFYVNTPNHY